MDRFPSNENWPSILCSIIFLRLICPAIFDPISHRISSNQPTKEGKRGLILLSKIVQSVANNSFFDDTVPTYRPINQFIAQYHPKLLSFMQSLTEVTPAIDESLNKKKKKKKEKKKKEDPFVIVLSYILKYYFDIDVMLQSKVKQPTPREPLDSTSVKYQSDINQSGLGLYDDIYHLKSGEPLGDYYKYLQEEEQEITGGDHRNDDLCALKLLSSYPPNSSNLISTVRTVQEFGELKEILSEVDLIPEFIHSKLDRSGENGGEAFIPKQQFPSPSAPAPKLARTTSGKAKSESDISQDENDLLEFIPFVKKNVRSKSDTQTAKIWEADSDIFIYKQKLVTARPEKQKHTSVEFKAPNSPLQKPRGV